MCSQHRGEAGAHIHTLLFFLRPALPQALFVAAVLDVSVDQRTLSVGS